MIHNQDTNSMINPEFQGIVVGHNEFGGDITWWYVPHKQRVNDVIAESHSTDMVAKKGCIVVTISHAIHRDYTETCETFIYLHKDKIGYEQLKWLEKVSYGKAFDNPSNVGLRRSYCSLIKLHEA